ncbi:MAG: diaminopimelate epimerase [Steroidobacteraceae bacterium]
MRIDFTKMHGLGNDFLIFEANGTWLPDAAQWRALSDRHRGIGFDQALVLFPARRADTVAYYRIFNADGGEVEQCGNGARCVAELLRLKGRASNGLLVLDSPAGLIRARLDGHGRASVDMGEPRFESRALPFVTHSDADPQHLQVDGATVEFGIVSVGNPHAVLTVDDVDEAEVERFGPPLERHVAFPQRVNVGFMQIATRDHIHLRVFERGVGETLACGTGACAAVAIGRRRGLLDADVKVSLPGGDLRVHWQGPDESLWLEGPAEVSFQGRVDIGS